MPHFDRLVISVTLLLFIKSHSEAFMFNGWLRSGAVSTEQNPSTPTSNQPVQYKYQIYGNNDAPKVSNIYEPKKDTGKAINDATPRPSPLPPRGPTDKEVIAAYNNQRTGISAPPKYDKPSNGAFNAVVVHSIPSVIPSVVPSPAISYVAIPAAHNYPYFYYRDDSRAHVHATPPPRKSVQVELNYKDDSTVQKFGESVVLPQKTPPEVITSGNETSSTSIDKSSPSTPQPQQQNPTSDAIASSGSEPGTKLDLPNRPIKLLSPGSTFATVASNFTYTPQLYYAPAPQLPPANDFQYVPYPFFRSPLVSPFLYKNIPRAVSERSEIASSDVKTEKPICENCLFPSNFFTYPSALKIFGNRASETSNQKTCAQENPSNSQANSKSPNFAYIFVPSHIVKNNVPDVA